MWNRQDYRLLLANNFLRNISLDGSHNDTALRIFKQKGLPEDMFPQRNEASGESDERKVTFETSVEVFRPPPAEESPLPSQSDTPSILIDEVDSFDPTHVPPLEMAHTNGTERSRGASESEAAGGDRFDPLSQSLNLSSASRKGMGGGAPFDDPIEKGSRTPPPLSRKESRSEKWRRLLGKATTPPVTDAQFFKRTSSTDGSVGPVGGPSKDSLAVGGGKISSNSGRSEIKLLSSLKSFSLRNERVCLVSGLEVPCMLFSILPYAKPTHSAHHPSKGSGDMSRTRHSSGSSASGLRPFDLDADEEISYARFLSCGMESASASSRLYLPPLSPASGAVPPPFAFEEGEEEDEDGGLSWSWPLSNYNPGLLDDPLFGPTDHKTTLSFPGYMPPFETTIVDYVDPSELKKEVNEKFREKFPAIVVTLSKIRSLKRELREIALDADLDMVTLAHAYVYFEKVIFRVSCAPLQEGEAEWGILEGLVNKGNRKAVAGACLMVAAKLNDYKGSGLSTLLEKVPHTIRLCMRKEVDVEVESQLRLHRKELLPFELPISVALEFALHLPEDHVVPHYHRLLNMHS